MVPMCVKFASLQISGLASNLYIVQSLWIGVNGSSAWQTKQIQLQVRGTLVWEVTGATPKWRIITREHTRAICFSTNAPQELSLSNALRELNAPQPINAFPELSFLKRYRHFDAVANYHLLHVGSCTRGNKWDECPQEIIQLAWKISQTTINAHFNLSGGCFLLCLIIFYKCRINQITICAILHLSLRFFFNNLKREFPKATQTQNVKL